MSELRELYQEMILGHNKNPKNYRVIEDASHNAIGNNPLCGDKLAVYLNVSDDGVIDDVSFLGEGCAISKASASLMTISLKGKTREEARELFDKFHGVITTPIGEEQKNLDELGKLAVLAGVREYPVRVKCASLCWHTLNAALAGEEQISTE
ncbi:MAG: SUF system NifU family Fe-S cluster assembly protein [Candidatus Lindowbacteria bacterium]|nr:SUF system NifU family Fe-S cluster assembly protein [Candidatus Lindowbacteria bacterium]